MVEEFDFLSTEVS